MDTRFKFIVNPAAGRGAVKRSLPALRRAARELIGANPSYDLVETAEPRHATELAQEAVFDGYETVVAVGGDGVIHEVVNGLMAAGNGQESPAKLGIIPLGSGNDFIKMLDVPTDLVAACRRLIDGQSRLVDLGCVNGQYFVNVAGFGFDTAVAVETKKIKRLTGFPLYLVAVLRTLLLTYHTPHVTMWLDEDTTVEQTVTLVEVTNGRCLAGGFWLAPNAEINDGLFDVIIADELSRFGILRLIPDVMRGTHLDKDPITVIRARRIVVDSAVPLSIQADGEIPFTDVTRIEFEIVPRSLRVV